MDLWGARGFLSFFWRVKERERAKSKIGERRVTPSPGLSAVYETSQKLTVIRVPEHGVFVVPNVLEELHDPVADVLYLAEVRLYGHSRYNVGAAVGLGLTQPLVTRVI